MTCAATWQTDSGITGFTLPGMIELPGCTSGSSISPIPPRGPEPSQRISLHIFIRLTATVFSEPLASTTLSRVLCAWKWFVVSRTSTPSTFESRTHTRPENSGCVLTPVPTAVPPRATSLSSRSACRSRSMPRSICPACPRNSCPKRTGVASCKCVRPVLITGMNSSDFCRNPS